MFLTLLLLFLWWVRVRFAGYVRIWPAAAKRPRVSVPPGCKWVIMVKHADDGKEDKIELHKAFIVYAYDSKKNKKYEYWKITYRPERGYSFASLLCLDEEEIERAIGEGGGPGSKH